MGRSLVENGMIIPRISGQQGREKYPELARDEHGSRHRRECHAASSFEVHERRIELVDLKSIGQQDVRAPAAP